MQKLNICNVVEGANLPSFLRNLDKAQKSSSMIELRADFVRGLTAGHVNKLATKTKITSIFTCRNVSEGGKYIGSVNEQKAIIKAALAEKFNYVDIALDNPFIEELSSKERKKLLISYHNFKATPSSIELMALMERMRESDPAIIKIATMVSNDRDVFTLAEILKQKRPNEKLIVIGMGDKGKLTRVLFPLLGSYLTYASYSAKAAPGILTQKEIQTVFNILS